MKRTLLLAGCLLLCAFALCDGVRDYEAAKKVAQQQVKKTESHPYLVLPQQEGKEVNVCVDQEGHWLSCPDEQQSKPMPPMVAPTMHDVVTHSQELSCPKGYSEKHLLLGDAIPQNWQEVFSDEYLVCVTPSFIAELKRANGEQK